MEDGENKIAFIKDVEITDRKTDTMYSALRAETEEYTGVESLSRFGNDGASVIIWHRKAASKLKRGIISK